MKELPARVSKGSLRQEKALEGRGWIIRLLIGRRFLRLSFERLPIPAQPDQGIPSPYPQLGLHFFGRALSVVVPNAAFAADCPSERKNLRFLQFSAAVATMKKQAFGFP